MSKEKTSIREKIFSAEVYSSAQTGRFKGRYIFIGLAFALACLMILVQAARIQLSGEALNPVSESEGQSAQMRVPAARGDIVDSNGAPLAYSVSSPMLYLTDCKLNNRQLNDLLLDLANLLEENDIPLTEGLDKYFDISSESDFDQPDTIKFVFKQKMEDVLAWQSNKDLFNLAPATSKDPLATKVKTDPRDFYEYLLFDCFKIENSKAAGDFHYTTQEALSIMKLRYLLLKDNWQFVQGGPVKLAGPINDKVIAVIQEQNQRYRGAQIIQESTRHYSEDSGLFGHVLGYTGKINDQEYERLKQFDYSLEDLVGKSGVEQTAERYLHGKSGIVPYNAWRKAGKDNVFVQGYGGIAPQRGGRVRLTLNKQMQLVTRQALVDCQQMHRERGLGKASSLAAVMLDVNDGSVLAMDSIPSYDPKYFELAGQDKKAAEIIKAYLEDDFDKPMLNRCISEIYSPGSTFKPITAAAGLEKGVINQQSSIYTCGGTEEIGEKVWSCYERPYDGHGPIDLQEAMVTSCNLYFFKLGIDTGIDQISATANKLGLGDYSDIDLPNEASGFVPSRELKRETREKPEDQIWFPADTAQSSIGQFDNAYTLIQLARAIGGVATNQLVTPHVIKEIVSEDGSLIRPEQVHVEPLNFKEETVGMVRHAMRALKERGGYNTQYYFQDYPIDVSCKTGSAEVINKDADGMMTNAMYVCFAPTDKPQVAIAIMVEDATAGDFLACVARAMLDGYFGTESKPMIAGPLQAKPDDFSYRETYKPGIAFQQPRLPEDDQPETDGQADDQAVIED